MIWKLQGTPGPHSEDIMERERRVCECKGTSPGVEWRDQGFKGSLFIGEFKT